MDLNGNKSSDFFEHAMVIACMSLIPCCFTEYNTIQYNHHHHLRRLHLTMLFVMRGFNVIGLLEILIDEKIGDGFTLFFFLQTKRRRSDWRGQLHVA